VTELPKQPEGRLEAKTIPKSSRGPLPLGLVSPPPGSLPVPSGGSPLPHTEGSDANASQSNISQVSKDEAEALPLYSRTALLAFRPDPKAPGNESDDLTDPGFFSQAIGIEVSEAPEAKDHDRDLPVLPATVASSQWKPLYKVAILDAMVLLLEASGGNARLGNFSAACMALGILSGTHQQVYQEVLSLVQSSPFCFTPVATPSAPSSLNKVLVSLTPTRMAALKISFPLCLKDPSEQVFEAAPKDGGLGGLSSAKADILPLASSIRPAPTLPDPGPLQGDRNKAMWV
ncbi:unnamed protein product, partial [Polarella glacialis]